MCTTEQTASPRFASMVSYRAAGSLIDCALSSVVSVAQKRTNMQTPKPHRSFVPIVVEPPDGPAVAAAEPLLISEARQIVKAIAPSFTYYGSQYDTKKYWPEVYTRVGYAFRQPAAVTSEMLRDALLWKYGHLQKPAIPPAHERLISQLQRGWVTTAMSLPHAPEGAFEILDRDFGGKTRFVTVAFLLHLLHPDRVPIIDQHNFRAVNTLMAGVRRTWKTRRQPSRYADILLIASFMNVVLAAWRDNRPDPVPTSRDLDKFLMMYGKALKQRSAIRQC